MTHEVMLQWYGWVALRALPTLLIKIEILRRRVYMQALGLSEVLMQSDTNDEGTRCFLAKMCNIPDPFELPTVLNAAGSEPSATRTERSSNGFASLSDEHQHSAFGQVAGPLSPSLTSAFEGVLPAVALFPCDQRALILRRTQQLNSTTDRSQ